MTRPQWELLSGLVAEDGEKVLALGIRKTLAEGDILFSLGAEATHIYLVERGGMNLTMPVRIGGIQKEMTVEDRGQGQSLGWSALIPPHRFTLQAQAREPTQLLAISRADLFEFSSRNPAAGYTVISNLARVVGQRLQIFQAMWIREMQRYVELRDA